jgi:hypothetical protein
MLPAANLLKLALSFPLTSSYLVSFPNVSEVLPRVYYTFFLIFFVIFRCRHRGRCRRHLIASDHDVKRLLIVVLSICPSCGHSDSHENSETGLRER